MLGHALFFLLLFVRGADHREETCLQNGDRYADSYSYPFSRIHVSLLRISLHVYDRARLNDMTLPAAVPEIPVASIDRAVAYYVERLGFVLDWGDEGGGIAGISRGDCRLFLTNGSFRESYKNRGPILFWLNLDSKSEVDELFAEWKSAQAKLVSEPEDKPWMLREFMAADADGNLLRVFHDFRRD